MAWRSLGESFGNSSSISTALMLLPMVQSGEIGKWKIPGWKPAGLPGRKAHWTLGGAELASRP